MRAWTALVAIILLVPLTPPADAQDPTVQTVGTQEAQGVTVNETTFPVLDPTGSPTGEASWRVVLGTGNCCEHYLATTPDGRILDFGGTFLLFSDDRGRTWHQVETPVPYASGEGAVSAAPDGDVVGVGWTPYTGDQLWAHRYEADEDQWYYAPIPVHTPFHDRPWMSVVPGPIETETGSSDHAVLIDGWPTHQAIMASLDGLHYDEITNQHLPLPGEGGGPAPAASPLLDWIQPHREAGITPLGDGSAIGPTWVGCADGQRGVLEPDLAWRCRATDLPAEGLLSDAQGRLHHVRAEGGEPTVVYRVSEDGGQAWARIDASLPPGLVVADLRATDVAANAELGQTVVAVHALDEDSNTHQDLVLRFWVDEGEPIHHETLLLGAGDHLFGANIASTGPRFDFSSVALLPDGRVVASFADANHTSGPALGIEKLPPEPPEDPSEPEDGNETDPGDIVDDLPPPTARFTIETDGWTIAVNASPSWDPDGNITTYAWDWGDGTVSQGMTQEHAYTEPGNHTITLTVTDDDGQRSTMNRTVSLTEETLEPASSDGASGEDGIPAPGALATLLIAALLGVSTARRRSD